MQQYPGWDAREGKKSSAPAAASAGAGDSSSAAVKDALVSELLEDMETRQRILCTMSDAGVPPAVLRDIYTKHVRTFLLDGGSRCAQAGARRRVYLAHDEDRNLHVSVFGWSRFRGQDIAFIMKAGGPFIELGAGSGWLGEADVMGMYMNRHSIFLCMCALVGGRDTGKRAAVVAVWGWACLGRVPSDLPHTLSPEFTEPEFHNTYTYS